MNSLSPLAIIIILFLIVLVLSLPDIWRNKSRPKLVRKMLRGWALMFAGALAIMLAIYLGFKYLPIIIPVIAIFVILGGGFLAIIIAPFILKIKK
jgi:hypothetical protein